MDDSRLLGRYVSSGCQDSFRQIVTRHWGWVFGLSLRAVKDRHLAEDVTQAVFLILARKARSISPSTPLCGWLFRTSRFAVRDAIKQRARLRSRETRAGELLDPEPHCDPTTPLVTQELAETLDEAIATLGETDRQAILLRFYEGKNIVDVASALGMSDEAAKKRVARAVLKLRKQIERRGLSATLASILLILLLRRSAVAADSSGAAAALLERLPHGDPILVKSTLRLMRMAQAKLLGAIFTAMLVLLIAGPTLGSAARAIFQSVPTTRPALPVEQAKAPPPPTPPATRPAPPPRRTIALQEEPRFAQLWIGRQGQWLWRSDQSGSGDLMPFVLGSLKGNYSAYAIAQDHTGNYWIKPVDSSLADSPQFDFDSFSSDRHAVLSRILSLIDGPFVPPGEIAPDPDYQLKSGGWQPMRQQLRDDNIVLDDMLRTQMLNDMNPSGFTNQFAPVEVPEPSGMLALCAAAVILLGRNRRVAPSQRHASDLPAV